MAVALQLLIEKAVNVLAASGVYMPEAEAEKLLAYVFNFPREELKQRQEQEADTAQLQHYANVLARRCAREPLSRIIGEIDFAGNKIKLSPHVFEPMVESESLIEKAALLGAGKPWRMLDIGAGSGALLLGILKALPLATGVGVDCKEEATICANENAQLNGLAKRAQFITGDLVLPCSEKFDLIITNMPFVPRALLKKLMPEVREHEPLDALDGGRDGLAVYRRLLKTIAKVQRPDTVWFVQSSLKALGPMQHLFKRAGYANSEVIRNAYGVPIGLKVVGQANPSWLNRLLGI